MESRRNPLEQVLLDFLESVNVRLGRLQLHEHDFALVGEEEVGVPHLLGHNPAGLSATADLFDFGEVVRLP